MKLRICQRKRHKRRFSQLRLSVYQKIAAIIAALLVPTVGMLINYCFGVELSLLQIAGLWVTVALTAFISVQLSGIFMRFIGDAGDVFECGAAFGADHFLRRDFGERADVGIFQYN